MNNVTAVLVHNKFLTTMLTTIFITISIRSSRSTTSFEPVNVNQEQVAVLPFSDVRYIIGGLPITANSGTLRTTYEQHRYLLASGEITV